MHRFFSNRITSISVQDESYYQERLRLRLEKRYYQLVTYFEELHVTNIKIEEAWVLLKEKYLIRDLLDRWGEDVELMEEKKDSKIKDIVKGSTGVLYHICDPKK